MCVIAYKSRKAKMPSADNVSEMWKANPHGAGVMWREKNGSVSWAKGFMKLPDFQKFLDVNAEKFGKTECALHFRIATHGGISPGNCHPFPVVEDVSAQHALEGNSRRVLMHNGVLPLVPRAKDLSDSSEMALRLGGRRDPDGVLGVFGECLEGNRIILMDEKGTHFHGDAFQSSALPGTDGILYSNLHWEPFKPACGPFLGGAFWDDKSGCFRDRSTGFELELDEVDPCDLTDREYDIWCAAYDDDEKTRLKAADVGVSPSEYRTLEIEAGEYGMSVEEYVDYLDGIYDPCGKPDPV